MTRLLPLILLPHFHNNFFRNNKNAWSDMITVITISWSIPIGYFILTSAETKQEMVVGILAATHHVDGKTKILIQGTNVEDHVLRMIGRWIICLNRKGGAMNTPFQMVVTATGDRSESILSEVISSTWPWIFPIKWESVSNCPFVLSMCSIISWCMLTISSWQRSLGKRIVL